MSTMVSGNFAKLRTPGYRKVFFDKFKQFPDEYSHIFNMDNSVKYKEEDFPVAMFGSAPEKAEMSPIVYASAVEGDAKAYTHKSYAYGFVISEELQEDDLYNIVGGKRANKLTKGLARSMHNTVENTAWDVLNRAFNSSYKGFDGLSLCNTAHVLLGTGGTASNKPSTDVDLSFAALQDAIENFGNAVGDEGMPFPLTPKWLVITPSQEVVANELLDSIGKPYTSDNTVNVLRQKKLQIFVRHYADDADSWFLLGDQGEHDLNFFWRKKPVFSGVDDEKTKAAFFSVFSRFSAGFGHWLGVYGSSGG